MSVAQTPPVTELVKVLAVIGSASTQVVVKETLDIPAPKPDAEKILDVFKTVNVTGVDVIENKVIVRGEILLQIVYVANEPHQPVHHMHQRVPFTTFVDVPGARPDMDVVVKAEVEDVSAKVHDHHRNKITVTAVVKVTVKVTETRQLDVLVQAPATSNPVTQTLSLEDVVGETRKQVMVAEVVDVPAEKPCPEKILEADAKVFITEKKVITNKVVVSGTLELQIIYVAREPDQPVHHMHQRVDFTVAFDVPGARPGMSVTVNEMIEHLDVDLKGDCQVDIKAVLEMMVKVTETRTMTVVTQATNVPGVVPLVVTVLGVVGEVTSQVLTKDIVSIPDPKPCAQKVFAVNVHEVCIDHLDIIPNKVIVTGRVKLQIVYVADSPDQPVHHMHAEVGFKHFLDVPGATPDMDADVKVNVEFINSELVDKGCKIKIELVLKVSVRVTETRVLNVLVRGIVTGPCPAGTTQTDYVVVRGDTLSAIARRFGTTVSAIVAVNPQITDPNVIFPGQIIIICAAPQGMG